MLVSAIAVQSPPTVTIVGTDYAFQVPAWIHAGPTLLAFENHGTVRHEMSIVRVKAGISADSVLQELAKGSPKRNFIDGQGALIVAAPGAPSGPKLWLDLERGRTYLVLCTLKNAPDQPAHLSLGMMGKFRPE